MAPPMAAAHRIQEPSRGSKLSLGSRADRGDDALPSPATCDDECQRDKDDLKAQEDMADAAWAMFAATLVGTLLTGMGVVLVYLNLREARVVSGEAKKSSDAATLMARR